jgi:hypothetical protein
MMPAMLRQKDEVLLVQPASTVPTMDEQQGGSRSRAAAEAVQHCQPLMNGSTAEHGSMLRQKGEVLLVQPASTVLAEIVM